MFIRIRSICLGVIEVRAETGRGGELVTVGEGCV